MASERGIAAMGRSLERFLTLWFSENPPIDGQATRAALVRTKDLETGAADGSVIREPCLSILVYRVDCDYVTRPGWAAVGAREAPRLPVELRFLITPWAGNPQDELSILGSAMQALDVQPILSGPLLATLGEDTWATGEAVHVCIDSVKTETVMETFESLPIDYKLSVPYVARVVRLDQRAARGDVPVLTAAVGALAEVPEEFL